MSVIAAAAALLVPARPGVSRDAVLRRLHEITAAVGPQFEWHTVARSVDLAMRVWVDAPRRDGPIDVDRALASLVVNADPPTRARLHDGAPRIY